MQKITFFFFFPQQILSSRRHHAPPVCAKQGQKKGTSCHAALSLANGTKPIKISRHLLIDQTALEHGLPRAFGWIWPPRPLRAPGTRSPMFPQGAPSLSALGQDSFLPCILAKEPFAMGQSPQAELGSPWGSCPSDIPRPAHGAATVNRGCSELTLVKVLTTIWMFVCLCKDRVE